MTLTDPRDRAALRALALQYGIDLRELMAAGVAQLITWGAEQAARSRIVDFTDMVFLPVHLTLEAPQFDSIFTDECQDLNVAQRELVSSTITFPL
jgi:superfamily I DNA/RNA helicase